MDHKHLLTLTDLLDDLSFYQQHGIGVINASPLCMGLINNASPPDWHLAPNITQNAVKKAARLCQERQADLGNKTAYFP